MELEILVFQCEQRHFGVEAHYVREVLRAVSLTPVPKAPDAVMGLVNLRGHVIPVLDTKRLLGLGRSTIRTSDHLIVIKVADCEFAWHVDHAVDLLRIRPDDGEVTDGETVTDSDTVADNSAETDNGDDKDHTAIRATTAETTKASSSMIPPSRLLRTVAKTHLGVVQVIEPTTLYLDDAMRDVRELAASVVATEYTT
ncbi:chemotaxis protein CheW [Novipirellula caenicola]|uniref:CheW-like domain-containing protein n=1 Tax=Novipirellula caenicola TaxID=1536901 RepID=A0ABP9VS64_9BACT